MAKHIVSLSQMLENDNRRREHTLSVNGSRTIPYAAANAQPPHGMQPGPMLKKHRPTSKKYIAALPLPSLLQSRYSRMLMETSESRRVAPVPRDDIHERSSTTREQCDPLHAERLQQLMDTVQSLLQDKQKETEAKSVKATLKKRKLDELEQDKRQRRDAKEQQRQHEHAEKLRRRQTKQDIQREKDVQRQACKAEKAHAKQTAEDAKANRKLEKQTLKTAALEIEQAEHLARQKAKELKRLAKDKAAAKRVSELRALSTRVWKLEHQRAVDAKESKALGDKIHLLAKTTKDLLAENKKLVKAVQEHKKVVTSTSSQLNSTVKQAKDTISTTSDNLHVTMQQWRDRGAGRLPKSTTTTPPPVNRILLDDEDNDEVFAIVDPTAAAAVVSSDENNPDSFGSTFAQDMIQHAREKRQRKQQHNRRRG
ncbi:hypothetical protein H257_00849 [Aphanomyces astaci]|uniref:Uncharacterized protein n=1 Tax=Aphanomyces astaci TaxID=112090 RepID=W4HCD8_APHAT|nr:hypothetical protein H257_00849 [Aphanomyces astaci]ETV89650.1 hypothetical protein H257_00849 [Aphanomyces astaci]|eukprot:XP_009822050.1 hypothetical protein H257_00849 [Aphanomyces astaci]